MKKLLCSILIVSSASAVFAESYINRPVDNTSPNSSIMRTNVSDTVNNKDYGPVINDLNKRIRENPNDYLLYVHLIEAYLKTDQYREAFNELEFLSSLKKNKKLSQNVIADINNLKEKTINQINNSTNKSPLYINIAIMELISGSIQEAEKYTKLAAYNTTDPELYADCLKIVFDNSLNFQTAIDDINICLQNNVIDDKGKVEISRAKVNFLIAMKKYNEAITEQISILNNTKDEKEKRNVLYFTYKLLRQVNATDDKILTTLFNAKSKNKEYCYYELYRILIERNDDREAQIYFEKITKQYPNSLGASFIEAEKLAREGKVNQVAKILDSISDKLTNNEDIATFNRIKASITNSPEKEAMNLFNQGYPDKALELLEGKHIPNTPDILAFKARCCLELGNKKQAFDYLNSAISIDADNLYTNVQFGDYYFMTGDYATARKFADKAFKIAPDNEYARMLKDRLDSQNVKDDIDQLAIAYENQNYAEATRLINKGLKSAPNSSIIYFYRGLVYIAQNNYLEAINSLSKAQKLDKTNVDIYYYLAIAYDNLSKYANAYNYYKQYLRLLPYDAFGESEKIEYVKNRINKLQTLL